MSLASTNTSSVGSATATSQEKNKEEAHTEKKSKSDQVPRGDEEEEELETKSFAELGLDDRLQKAIAKIGWREPTMIQTYVITHALAGKDILARARTGSGKTGAYALPMLHSVLTTKARGVITSSVGCSALVLVPTKELARQASKNLKDISKFCSRKIAVLDVSGDGSVKNQKAALLDAPDILIGTPSKVLAHITNDTVDLSQSLKMLVIDEADLVFSYGYEDDLVKLLALLPVKRQNMLMSATLGSEVDALKKLVLQRPVILKLEESDLPDNKQLLQHTIQCTPDDRYLITYAMLKLRLLRGKTIIFLNDVNECYKLKLFFDSLSIKACVLNSELPIQSRQHIVEQFNKDVYDYVIASDESASNGGGDDKKSGKRKRDEEYGVSRGVDFKGVKNVLNFDFPLTPESYVHRVGRTARGHNAGVALSLVSIKDQKVLTATQELLKQDHNEESPLKPYAFKLDAIEGLRYRVRDCLKGVTKHAVREARRKEIRQEILNSEVLKQHFEENPRDAEVLRHDAGLMNVRKVKSHLKHVPKYLVPKGVEAAVGKKKKDVSKYANSKSIKAKQTKFNNPLKSFGKKKKK